MTDRRFITRVEPRRRWFNIVFLGLSCLWGAGVYFSVQSIVHRHAAGLPVAIGSAYGLPVASVGAMYCLWEFLNTFFSGYRVAVEGDMLVVTHTVLNVPVSRHGHSIAQATELHYAEWSDDSFGTKRALRFEDGQKTVTFAQGVESDAGWKAVHEISRVTGIPLKTLDQARGGIR